MGATGTSTVDFGVRDTQTSVAVTGQTGILSGSLVEGWVSVSAVATTTTDETIIEHLQVRAGAISPGVGFTIYVYCFLGYAHGQYNINWVWN